MLKWILPFQRCFHVTLFLSSGRTLCFTCTHLTRSQNGDRLTGLKTEWAFGWPLFIDLTAVQAVQTKRVWRRRP